MKFDIIKKDQYLNVCIWSRSQEKNEKDILLGYVSNYLMLLYGKVQCSREGNPSVLIGSLLVWISPYGLFPLKRSKARAALGNIGLLSFLYVLSRPRVNISQYGPHARLFKRFLSFSDSLFKPGKTTLTVLVFS